MMLPFTRCIILMMFVTHLPLLVAWLIRATPRIAIDIWLSATRPKGVFIWVQHRLLLFFPLYRV